MTIQNTIIFNERGSTQSDCFNNSAYSGTVDSLGYNLIGSNTNCNLTVNDLVNVHPRFFTLYGSPAFRPLTIGSPAIDAGNPAGCSDHEGNLLDTDQRGVARIGRCDIGSYEYDPENDPLTYTFLPLVSSP